MVGEGVPWYWAGRWGRARADRCAQVVSPPVGEPRSQPVNHLATHLANESLCQTLTVLVRVPLEERGAPLGPALTSVWVLR